MSVEDLIPYQPGQSGNLSGRPKGCRDGIGAHARRLMKKLPKKHDEVVKRLKEKNLLLDDPNFEKVLAGVTMEMALSGDLKAIEKVEQWEREGVFGEAEGGVPESQRTINNNLIFVTPDGKVTDPPIDADHMEIHGQKFTIRKNGGNGNGFSHLPKQEDNNS